MAVVPHTNAFLDQEDARERNRKKKGEKKGGVHAAQSMPELGSKEYNVDDWDDDDDDEESDAGNKTTGGSPKGENAAAHGVLPRLNITQRWDTFDISASDEMVIHQHRLRRKMRQRKDAAASSTNLLRDTYVPDHTQVLEGLLSAEMRVQIRNTDTKVSALPSKDEMKKRHLQRRAHERLHGGSANSPGVSPSKLALSHSEKRREDLEEMMQADGLGDGSAGAFNGEFASNLPSACDL